MDTTALIFIAALLVLLLLILVGFLYRNDHSRKGEHLDDVKEIVNQARTQGSYLFKQAVQEHLHSKGKITWEDMYDINQSYQKKVAELQVTRKGNRLSIRYSPPPPKPA